MINNVDVASVREPAQIKDALVRQACNPVRWVEVIKAMAGQGVTHVAECGPGKVLAGLTKRIDGITAGAGDRGRGIARAIAAGTATGGMMLNGQVALVTGASRGIGRAIALELGKQGATVVGTATTDAGAAAITEYLAAAGIKGAGFALNVNDAAQADAVVGAVQKQFGDITVLVNNAGITRDNLLMRMKDEEWDDILETNLKSVFRLSKLVLRAMMKARTGRIINITSVVGAMGNAGQTNYAAAKAGMIGFSKSLAREIGSRNITVNCVAPGFIDTDMTRALSEAQRTALVSQIPLARLGRVEDIAGGGGVSGVAGRRAISPVRRCMSMAACTWIDGRTRR